ncbi:MAG: dTDP-4-dehydrorhamnose reductase [Methylococcaceae bacterium]
MKLLLLGKNGQVGWELQRSLAPLGEVIALDRHTVDGLCGDLSNLQGLSDTIRRVKPDVIVNAAAYTAVDKAESEPELANTINALATEVMAKEAQASGAWLVHYSTDYVFDGSGDKPWIETDKTGPLGVYGATKLLGEQLIQQSGCQHLIFRTSWVYGARGNNFAKTMLRLAKDRDTLNVIDDQVGAPTGAELLADVTAHAIRLAQQHPDVSGLYNLIAKGETSWFGYARFVLDFAEKSGVPLKVAANAINPIPTSAFPTPAKRPHNSRLDTSKLESTFNLLMPDWQSGVIRMLSEIAV